MRPAAEAEKAGIPAVVVTTTGFTTIAKSIGKSEGIANLRVAEYPGAVGVHPEELVDANVENVLFARIVGELTQPRVVTSTDSAANNKPADNIIFEGTFDEINAYFSERLWSDEMPIVPPTRERVEAFLMHTQRAADEAIAVLPQANLVATPRNIAANAVERGLLPQEYLVKPNEMVRVLPSADVINIVVCGDPDRNRLMVLWGGYVSLVTRKII